MSAWSNYFAALPILLHITMVHVTVTVDRAEALPRRPETEFTMTTRFCASCMADVGLNPAHSRLALPGCTQSRLVFCDGTNHSCTVLVNEGGEIVPQGKHISGSKEYSFGTMSIAKSSVGPPSAQGTAIEDDLVSPLVGSMSPANTLTELGPGA